MLEKELASMLWRIRWKKCCSSAIQSDATRCRAVATLSAEPFSQLFLRFLLECLSVPWTFLQHISLWPIAPAPPPPSNVPFILPPPCCLWPQRGSSYGSPHDSPWEIPDLCQHRSLQGEQSSAYSGPHHFILSHPHLSPFP